MAKCSKGRGVERVLAKLKANFNDGNYYEAHQMYRTLYFRFSAQNQLPELLELLYDGALQFLEHKQNESGADLSMLYVGILTKALVPVTEDKLECIARLYSLMLPDTPERAPFLTAGIKWSCKDYTEHRFGHPRLHQLVAFALWKEKNYQRSWFHFLRSMDGDGCASMLVEYHISRGYSSEVDLFIAQAVLQYLCLDNKVTASIVFFRYAERHPNIHRGPPFLLPLLNFLWFLLLIVESGKITAFTVLCDQYRSTIQRDPAYAEYLDKIGQLFFGLPPPRHPRNNIFGDFLSSFLTGVDEDDDDGMEPSGLTLSLQAEDLD